MWSPLGESVLNQTGRWQPEPLARGTFGILSTSLITLSLCLWTALHLNVPGEGLAKHHKWHRVLWLVLGLLAPEVVRSTRCSLSHRLGTRRSSIGHGDL